MFIVIVGMFCCLLGDVFMFGEFYCMFCCKRSGWFKVFKDCFIVEVYYYLNFDKKGCFNFQGGYFIKDDIFMFDVGFFDIIKKEVEFMGKYLGLMGEVCESY